MAETANIALNPAHPLHITLPTFRMVILADELLEQFFEVSFPTSFQLSDGRRDSRTTTSPSSNLTTFANLQVRRPPTVGASTPHALDTNLVSPGRGLRGVLDNLVNDGMRVATDFRRRMDEAQREMERNALSRDADDEQEDDERLAGGGEGADAERRSVREVDRELLQGAEAEVESVKGDIAIDSSQDLVTTPTVDKEGEPIWAGADDVSPRRRDSTVGSSKS